MPTRGVHAMPTALNAFTAAVARAKSGEGAMGSGGIHVSSNPLPVRPFEKITKEYQFVFKFTFICCFVMAVSSLAASYSVFIVQERVNNSKQVQLVSGINKVVFWSSHFLWDMTMYLLPAFIIIMCFYQFHLPEFEGRNLPAVVILLLTYGLASIPAVYTLQFFFHESFKAFLRLWTVFFLSGYVFFLANWIFGMISDMSRVCRTIHKVLKWTLPVLSPQFNIANAFYNLIINNANPFDPFAVPKDPFTLEVAGYSIIFLCVQMVLFSALVLCIEYAVPSKLWMGMMRYGWGGRVLACIPCFPCMGRRRNQADADSALDSGGPRGGLGLGLGVGTGTGMGMGAGSDGLANVVASSGGELLVVKDLRKKYAPGLPFAVNGLSFEVGRNECFGLLGVNGAGKTSTFKMLTGECLPTSGTAAVCGHDIVTATHTARLFMGYCPQFEAVIGNMTGKELLHMYAMVRGLPSGLIAANVNRIIAKLDLGRYAGKLAGTYSGGNKRKLAVGAAVVGDPQVVLLDEPSTGMDPVAKRFLWNVLADMYREEDKSIVLTSHSMAECEALCSRIGIMVAGRFKCLGHVQEVKNDFGEGYHVEFRFESTDQLSRLITFMEVAYPRAALVEKTDLYCLFQIKQEEAHLPRMFKAIREAKEEVGFESFSVSQTSLEQVFIKFANA